MSDTKAIKAILAICATVIEVLEECPQGLPEGHLYALLMPMGCKIEQFNQLVSLLVGSGKVKKRGHLLVAA